MKGNANYQGPEDGTPSSHIDYQGFKQTHSGDLQVPKFNKKQIEWLKSIFCDKLRVRLVDVAQNDNLYHQMLWKAAQEEVVDIIEQHYIVQRSQKQ